MLITTDCVLPSWVEDLCLKRSSMAYGPWPAPELTPLPIVVLYATRTTRELLFSIDLEKETFWEPPNYAADFT